jgi:hypothetical protein
VTRPEFPLFPMERSNISLSQSRLKSDSCSYYSWPYYNKRINLFYLTPPWGGGLGEVMSLYLLRLPAPANCFDKCCVFNICSVSGKLQILASEQCLFPKTISNKQTPWVSFPLLHEVVHSTSNKFSRFAIRPVVSSTSIQPSTNVAAYRFILSTKSSPGFGAHNQT